MKRHRAILGALAGLVLASGFGVQDGFERERGGRTDEVKNAIEGKAPPAFAGTWFNTRGPLDWDLLKGKVVLLDFWTHWCGPCRAATPHIKALASKFGPKGLVVIGVHSDPNREKMAEVAKELGMNYPLLFDGDKTVLNRFGADSFPDYYLVDRKGILRFADLANREVDRAVELLIAEKP